MKPSLTIISAALLLLTLAGCSNDRLKRPASDIGASSAHVALPVYPDRCRIHTPHAQLLAGEDALAALKREREALNNQNYRTDICANFYDNLRHRLN